MGDCPLHWYTVSFVDLFRIGALIFHKRLFCNKFLGVKNGLSVVCFKHKHRFHDCAAQSWGCAKFLSYIR